MEAVTSTDYDSTINCGRNFNNHTGYNGYNNYIHFTDKYNQQQFTKNSDDNPSSTTKSGPISRPTSRHVQDNASRYARSQSQPERQHHSSHETRSKSQDSRELLLCQQKSAENHIKFQRTDKLLPNTTELTFYEIDGPKVRETKISQLDRTERRDKTSLLMKCGFGRNSQLEQKTSFMSQDQPNKLSVENDHFRYQTRMGMVEPPKYRPIERPPKYQEATPKVEPPPKYHQDPPKYSEVKKQDDAKQVEVFK